jgi:transposase
MRETPVAKIRNLAQAGLLNPAPERVESPLFREYPDFFDARDHLQVRYEMLRAHMVDHQSVVEICGQFGVSRQTFYILREKFLEEGSAGLLPKKPGPKGPVKLKAEVLAFVGERIESGREVSATQLLSEIEKKFAVSLHRRTIEKLLKKLLSKKNG